MTEMIHHDSSEAVNDDFELIHDDESRIKDLNRKIDELQSRNDRIQRERTDIEAKLATAKFVATDQAIQFAALLERLESESNEFNAKSYEKQEKQDEKLVNTEKPNKTIVVDESDIPLIARRMTYFIDRSAKITEQYWVVDAMLKEELRSVKNKNVILRNEHVESILLNANLLRDLRDKEKRRVAVQDELSNAQTELNRLRRERNVRKGVYDVLLAETAVQSKDLAILRQRIKDLEHRNETESFRISRLQIDVAEKEKQMKLDEAQLALRIAEVEDAKAEIEKLKAQLSSTQTSLELEAVNYSHLKVEFLNNEDIRSHLDLTISALETDVAAKNACITELSTDFENDGALFRELHLEKEAEVAKLQKDLAEEHEALEKLSIKLSEAKHTISLLEQEIETREDHETQCAEALERQKECIGLLQNRDLNLLAELHDKGGQIADLESRQRESEEKLAERDASILTLENKEAILNAETETLRKMLEVFNDKNIALEGRIDLLDSAAEELRTLIEDKGPAIASLQDEVTEPKKSLEKYEMETPKFEAEIDSLKQKLITAQSTSTVLEEAKCEKKLELATERKKLQAAEDKIATIEAKMRWSETNMSDLRASHRHAPDNIGSHKVDKADLGNSLAELNSRVSSLEATFGTVLKEAKDERTALASVIESDYEQVTEGWKAFAEKLVKRIWGMKSNAEKREIMHIIRQAGLDEEWLQKTVRRRLMGGE